MANSYDGDDREEIVKKQSETDPDGSTDDRRPEKRPEELEREPNNTPGSANGQ